MMSFDSKGNSIASEIPDFTVAFPDNVYGIIGEIKASFSPGQENFEKLEDQLRRYDEKNYIFRADCDLKTSYPMSTQDIMLVVRAKDVASIANYLKSNFAPQKNLVICFFEKDSSKGARTFYFSRYPYRSGKDDLRDEFLDNRISGFLKNRIVLPLGEVIEQRDYFIGASDDKGANRILGPAVKLILSFEREYAKQLRSNVPSDRDFSGTIRFPLQEAYDKISRPPYTCSLSIRQIKRILEFIEKSNNSLCEVKGNNVKLVPISRYKRFGPYSSSEILSELKQKYAESNLPNLCFHLARGMLLDIIEKEKKQDERKRQGQFTFPFYRLDDNGK